MGDTIEKLPNGWPIPKGSHVIVFCMCTLLFWLYLITDSDGYAGILDNFNLIIHKAGHMISGQRHSRLEHHPRKSGTGAVL